VLQLKDLRQWIVGEKVTVCGERILKKLEGLPGGRAWFAGHGGIVPTLNSDYTISV